MTELESHVALALVGAVAATLNVWAGGGSFLTLPLLIFIGLPPSVANGTNRVGILVQSIWGTRSFARAAVIDRAWLERASAPVLVGAGLGTGLAIVLGDAGFRRALATLMLAFVAYELWRPQHGRLLTMGSRRELTAAFFAAGLYGGFVQAGVGFLLLAITNAAGLDLVRGTAVKLACVLVFTPLSLGLFAWQGLVDWSAGGALALGSVVGSEAGVRLAILKGHRWLEVVVRVALVAFAVRLWWP